MNIAKARANKLLCDLGIDAPEHLNDLEAICYHLGAPVKYAPLGNCEGTLTLSISKAVITINSREIYPPRIRFSICHELGHFLLHREKENQFQCSEKDMIAVSPKISQKIEIEANDFAASFLMPDFMVKPELKGRCPSIHTSEYLSDKFGSSMTAAVRRSVELSDDACAVIFFNKERSIYSVKSSLFEEQGYYIAYNSLDQYSEAARAVQGRQSKNMTSVDADCWITNLPKSRNEAMLKEQAVYYDRYDFGISIIQLTDELLCC